MKFTATRSMKQLKYAMGVAASFAVCGLTQAAAPDIAGFWQPAAKVETLKTVNGETPPLTAEGKKLYEKHLEAAKKGDRSFDIETKCLPLGIPRLMAESPFEFVQSDKLDFIIFEWNRSVHQIDLRDKHDRKKHETEYAYPYYNGHSIGYTQGNALVVDTIYFNEDTTLDKSGLPHTEDLHVTQNFSLKDANTLEDLVTIEDAKMYSKPWQTKFTYTRMPAGAQLKEDVCVQRMGIKKLDSGHGK